MRLVWFQRLLLVAQSLLPRVAYVPSIGAWPRKHPVAPHITQSRRIGIGLLVGVWFRATVENQCPQVLVSGFHQLFGSQWLKHHAVAHG